MKFHLAWQNTFARGGMSFNATYSHPVAAMREAAKIGGKIFVYDGTNLYAIVETGNGKYMQRPPTKKEMSQFPATGSDVADGGFYQSFDVQDLG